MLVIRHHAIVIIQSGATAMASVRLRKCATAVSNRKENNGADEKFTALNRDLHEYLLDHGHNRDPLLAELAAETAKLGRIAGMQIAAEQGTLMAILVRAIGARNAIEVGTFTGYSSICVARALPPDGHLLCCDVNGEWTAIARRYWERAGLTRQDHAEARSGGRNPAPPCPPTPPSTSPLSTPTRSTTAITTRNASSACAPNGLILIDNVLWGGSVIDPSEPDRRHQGDPRAQ